MSIIHTKYLLKTISESFRNEIYSVSIYGNNFTTYTSSVQGDYVLSGIVALSDDCPLGFGPFQYS